MKALFPPSLWWIALMVLFLGMLPFIPTHSSLWPNAALQVMLAAGMGGIIHRLLLRLEKAKQRLERTALRDEFTGLENRQALDGVFARYMALAHRQGTGMLLSVWNINGLGHSSDQNQANVLALVQTLKSESRLEDAFFRVGDGEFVGLHLGLEHGAELSARVRARFARVAVGWSLAYTDGFEAAFIAAEDMMYANKARLKAKSRQNSVTVQPRE